MYAGRRLRYHDLWPASGILRAYIIVGLIEAAADITIESVILAKFEFLTDFFHADSMDERTALPVYLGIFVLAHIFQIFMAWEAVYNRNVIQIFGLCLFNLAFLVYAVIQISEIKDAFESLDNHTLDETSIILVSVIPGIIGTAEVIYCALSWYIYKLLGWQVFKKIGADRAVKRMYLNYQVFICILKFDFFFFISFSLQFVLLVLDQSQLERYLTLIAVPVSLILLYTAFWSVRRETRYGVYAVLVACVGASCFFAFKLYRMYKEKDGAYRLVFKSLTVFSALALALLIATFIFAIRCLRNFGKGLKPHLMVHRARAPTLGEMDLGANESTDSLSKTGLHFNYNIHSAHASRMSID